MHILFLTQIIPYPPDAGPRVKTWHLLRYLAEEGHTITLISFVRPEEEPYLPKLREICTAVHPVPIQRSRVRDVLYWLRSHLTGRPFLIERDDLQAMRQAVAKVMESQPIDVIHADQLTMAQFALPEINSTAAGQTRPLLLFDAHNAVWTIVERMRQNAPWFLKVPAAVEASRIKRYEGMILHTFDHTFAVTEQDRQALIEAASVYHQNGTPEVAVVPIAVDTQQLLPAQRQPFSKKILTLGTLHYPPNADGVRWFLREVFPRVRSQTPGASLTIIGKNPPQDFLQAAKENPGVIDVPGYVPNLDPYMDQAALMVVPVRAGGGMRVRILEAFARGMPVVTTTVGLEGIAATPGRDVLVADDPQAFAEAVTRLLTDPTLAHNLGENGRLLAQKQYDWQVVLKGMRLVYKSTKEPEEKGVLARG